MENKKLISARLSPRTLAKIDTFVTNRRYWKRNTVISNVLDAVFDCFDEKAIYNMMIYDSRYRQRANGSFSLEKASSD